jgi:hypothetical protein
LLISNSFVSRAYNFHIRPEKQSLVKSGAELRIRNFRQAATYNGHPECSPEAGYMPSVEGRPLVGSRLRSSRPLFSMPAVVVGSLALQIACDPLRDAD